MRAAVVILALFWTGTAEARDVSAVSWLVGCWTLHDQRGSFTEVWAAPPLPALLGYRFDHPEEGSGAWSQMRIQPSDDGVVMLAMPNGRGPVFYNWTEMALGNPQAGHVKFETEDHRFPESIVYDRDGDTLTETVTDWLGRSKVYAFQRMECSAISAVQ